MIGKDSPWVFRASGTEIALKYSPDKQQSNVTRITEPRRIAMGTLREFLEARPDRREAWFDWAGLIVATAAMASIAAAIIS